MHPILLVGVALAGLPILLHLILKQEPKRLPFPAIRFLQQKQKTNRRKMRLRHFLLLALRVLLIALFAATLYQPTAVGNGLLDLSGEQPVAAVFVIDTSPSMGYLVSGRTRLDDARGRALALIDELPPNSRVAVVDPADPSPGWEPSPADARRKIDALKEPSGDPAPVTAGLAAAYGLLRKVDAEGEPDGGPLPRLVVVVSDRTAGCWEASRADDLAKLRDAVPAPAVAHLFVDVGADPPADVAVLNAEVRPQVVPRGQPVLLTATVRAVGADVPDAVVRCREVDGAATPDRKPVALRADAAAPVWFTLRDLKPGFHQAEVALEAADRLPADNIRYTTFRVAEARKILTISDDKDAALYWQIAHDEVREFATEVKTPADDLGDLGGYELVCLLSVKDPRSLWARLRGYVEAGGPLLIIPGPDADPAAYANDLLPGRLVKPIDAPADSPPGGVAWALDDAALRRPLLAPFRDWKLRGTVDFLKNPRRAKTYFDVEAPPEAVVVFYDDDKDSAKRHPAVLERQLPKGGGKVVLLTVRMDTPADPATYWHNYWETAESSWAVVFPSLLARYLAGDAAETNYNFGTGQVVTLPLPKAPGKPPKLVLEGPGVAPADAFPVVADKQAELRLTPDKTRTPGNFVLRTEDGTWRTGFSLNPPADEFDLTKVPVAAVEAVCGPGSVVPAAKEVGFRDVIRTKFDQPVELFPWLLIGVLLLVGAEGVVANRFYRRG